MLIRVFPRRTNATPNDDNVRFTSPGLFDEADEVHVSVTWKEDKQKAEWLAHEWEAVTSNVKIGGPAYDDPGDEFEPGLYVKQGYVMTSRGCPNHCWFCLVPKREGNIRELKINEGFNIIDSNLLACSDAHIKNVFSMLAQQDERARFTGGLEAAKIKPWIAEEIEKLKPATVFFAYDEPSDYEPLYEAYRILSQYDILPRNPRHSYRCFVLCGYKGDTMEKAEKRIYQTLKLGLMPMAMLYDKEKHRAENDGWLKFQKHWARPQIVGLEMRRIHD